VLDVALGDVPVVPVVPAVVLVAGGVAVVPLVVPLVVAVEPALPIDPLPMVAFARVKLPLLVDPVVLAELSCRQPVTVTVLSSMDLEVDVVELGVCAVIATVVAHAIAAAIHTVRFIKPPSAF